MPIKCFGVTGEHTKNGDDSETKQCVDVLKLISGTEGRTCICEHIHSQGCCKVVAT